MTAVAEASPQVRMAHPAPPSPLGWCSDCVNGFCSHRDCIRYVQAVTMRDGTGLCRSCHWSTDKRRAYR